MSQQLAELNAERLHDTIEKLENCVHAGADPDDVEWLARELGVIQWMQKSFDNLKEQRHEPIKSY